MASTSRGQTLPSRGMHTSLPTWLALTWTNRWMGAGAAILLGALTALVSSAFMPRGPVTGDQGVVVIVSSVLVGVAAGYLMRSRWAIVLAPLAHMVAYELSRLGIAGASLDGFHLDNPYGIAAFVAGRGFHGLLALFPMAVGVSIGRALSRGRGGWSLLPTRILTAAVMGLAVLVAWPASTPPVLGPDGQQVPGSIAELTKVELGGTEQGISIRAANPDAPVLLYLSGGPGQTDLAYARVLLEPLVANYVVVVWDQRGTGTSYGALDPGADLTLDQAVADTVALTNYLRNRFGEEKIYLLGESWGTTLGVLAAQQHPELYHAYIGSGQMVSQRVTDQIIWRDLLADANRTENGRLYDQVLSLGEPPYRDTPWANSIVMGNYPLLETTYTPPAAYRERGEASGIGPYGILGTEYGFVEKANVIRGLVDTFSIMYPQLQEIDFRADVPSLEVPVYILDGANELRGRRELAQEWFAQLQAPSKRMVTYADAGHSVVFEEADDFLRLMNEEIVPATYPEEAHLAR